MLKPSTLRQSKLELVYIENLVPEDHLLRKIDKYIDFFFLTGKSLKACHNAASNAKIDRVVAWFAESKDNNIVFTSRNDKENKDVYMVALRDDNGTLIGYYEKHEYRGQETAELYAI